MTTRRRFLTIIAGGGAFAAMPPVIGRNLFGAPAQAGTGVGTAPRQWRGLALGADARIVLDHQNADELIEDAVVEIRRLEAIFSLFNANSQLSRLNRDGALSSPAFELIELLSICSGVHARTKGAFDPTVQSLWKLYASEYSAGRAPAKTQVNDALAQTGWRHVAFSPSEVSFRRQNVALTLNGIAQGYIADRVTGFLRRNGVRDVLVNAGEISALGHAPDGKPWQVSFAGNNQKSIALSDTAIATSAPMGTAFDDKKTAGHILDPRNGKPGGLWKSVSVISRSAAEADGLSTGFCLMNAAEIAAAQGDTAVILR